MPGTYIAGEPVVTIASFAPQLHVITSKQRPPQADHPRQRWRRVYVLAQGRPTQTETFKYMLVSGWSHQT